MTAEEVCCLGPGAACVGCWRVVLTFMKEQVTPQKACNEVVRTLMSSLDNTSALLRPALLPVLEGQAAELCLDSTNRQKTSATVRRMRWLERKMKLLSTDADTHVEVHLLERPISGTSDKTTQELWPLFLRNKAKLDVFRAGHPDNRYLESRRIFLPQGATLILRQWQSELNDFVNDLEGVSYSSGVWLETGCF